MTKKLYRSPRPLKTKTAAYSVACKIETLETRQLMSAVSPTLAVEPLRTLVAPVTTVTTSGQTRLTVDGTSGNDNIHIDCTAGIIRVARNNLIVSEHLASDVASISSNLFAGDDTFTMTGSFPSGPHVFVWCGAGHDTVKVIQLNATVSGQDGNDSIFCGKGNDYIDGGAGDDTIDAGAGFDRVFGFTGNDTINSGTGIDTVDGGFGNDVITLSAGTAKGGFGDDILRGSVLFSGNRHLYGDQGKDLLEAGPHGRAYLYGGDDDDVLNGGKGDDELYGEGGNDRLRGNEGKDRMFGGIGDDYIRASNDGSRDGIDGGAGFDTADVDDRSFFTNFWEVQDSWSFVEKVIKH